MVSVGIVVSGDIRAGNAHICKVSMRKRVHCQRKKGTEAEAAKARARQGKEAKDMGIKGKETGI